MPLPDVLALWLPLLLTVALALAVMEGLAPLESVPVGEEEALALRDCVEEGVEQGLGVALPVPDPVTEAEAVGAALRLLLLLKLPVTEGLAPLLRLPEGEALPAGLGLLLLLELLLAVGVGVLLLLPVPVPEGD